MTHFTAQGNILFQNCLLKNLRGGEKKSSGRLDYIVTKKSFFKNDLNATYIQNKQKQQKGKIFKRITIRQHISQLMQNLSVKRKKTRTVKENIRNSTW